jgi:NAD(P)-dependent dehydrogenase (short-subunit alcohol dehydrogenase family)
MNVPVCLVVGYGPGIGHGVATAFARRGSALLLLARDPQRHRAQLAALEPLGVPVLLQSADAADPAALAAVIEQGLASLAASRQAGGPVVLIYNAVASTTALPSDLPPAGLLADLSINVVGALAAAQAVLPALRQRGGCLLFTGGGLAHQPQAAVSSLATGKAALRSLVLCLAQELGGPGQGIGVGLLTILGQVAPDTAFDPLRIGEAFVDLAERLAKAESTPVEVLFQG